MKKLRLFIFTIVTLSLFLINVNAETFTCHIGGYDVEYNTEGKIVGVQGFSNKVLSSDFSPQNVNECPNKDEGKVVLTDGGISLNVIDLSSEEKDQDLGGCSGYSFESSCEYNKHYACIWNEVKVNGKTHKYCNTDELKYIQCGDTYDIPYQAPEIISLAVNLLKTATPIILIIVSIISLLKATAASNEDEIKKAQKALIRKAVAAAMVFFVISIVQFVVMKVADSDGESDHLSSCLSCFLNNDCGSNMYYKTNVFGKYECTYFKNPGKQVECKGNK